jgi:S-adenosylmethionine:tRNA ribosyltransferase-isomerase
VRTAELSYELPDELVARYPAREREESRLLVVGERGFEHRGFAELPALLPPGALLVINDTRVIPARLLGNKPSGGKVELLLVRRLAPAEKEGERWSAMAKSSRPLRAGAQVCIADGRLEVRVEAPLDRHGLCTLYVHSPSGERIDALLEELGHVPLPPYIERADEPADRDRYQTVYARVPGAVAAPTAGLHFSRALLDEIAARDIELGAVTLHVGPGTFRPVSAEDLADHEMHGELFEVSGETAACIDRARARGAPVVAVGTTVVRALESAADPERLGAVRALSGETQLLIQPGHRFRVVDALVTNFHLPGSTLLALVYAFGGVERVREAYRAAIVERYRFYSYGDAMYLAPQSRRKEVG